jgi:hypothetical protein
MPSVTLTKSTFLANPHVESMCRWLSQRFDGVVWHHAYIHRTTGRRWTCTNLTDAFRQYTWNGKPWSTNLNELLEYRATLRDAVVRNDRDAAFEVCAAILRWGGVWANNGRTLESRRAVLIDELRHLSGVLLDAEIPSAAAMRRDRDDPASICSMNAGFVKIYSVLLDYCVIYDGRVGAALGLLARQYCEEHGLAAVPDNLAFAYGAPKEAENPRNPKLRNPSRDGFRFPRLRQEPRLHTEQTMRANWFLRQSLACNPSAFSEGELGFHELAAGLFMVGYDLSEATALAL